MVENRRLLIVLALAILVGIGARFGLSKVPLSEGVYYREVPDETAHFKALDVYACDTCRDEIYDAVKNRLTREDADEVLATLDLYYNEFGQDGCCPNHPGQPLVKTTRIPIHPQVKFGLPEDTDYIKRIYLPKVPPSMGRPVPIELTIVISSKDRRSIHRAESCMNSQGWTINTRTKKTLACKGVPGGTLSVMSLLMDRTIPGQNGQPMNLQCVVFYWYAALPDRLTSSEYRRLALMFYDRLVKGLNFRWSYVLITQIVPPGVRAAAVDRQLERFVNELVEGIEDTEASE